MLTFDFETKAIQSRPDYPPEPVGVSVGTDVTRAHYHAWGHPEGNNATEPQGLHELQAHWDEPLLCHHAAFDIAVAHECMGLPLPKGEQVNDTMFMAFLIDPYGDLSLKPLAHKYLGLPPEEQERVRDWLYTHKVVRKNVKKWGAHIGEAPGTLVGPYANGDVERTRALFDYFIRVIENDGLFEAYRRECDLVPMLLDNSAQGIPLDHKRLALDTAKYERILRSVEVTLRARWPQDIGGTPPENFDSGDELAECLQRNKRIRLPETPTGRTSTAKDALMEVLPDCEVKGLLLYRSALAQSLQTYMRPWFEQGSALHANWNQVRDYSNKGAKTGRLSSSPNLQNMTNPEKYEELSKYMVSIGLPLPVFPNLRSYIVAPKGMVLFSRDYSQQEMRLLADAEDGVLAQAYRDNPDMDTHELVSEIIRERVGLHIPRKPTKTINFAKVYGAGVAKIAAQLGVSLAEAHEMLRAYDTALPSIRELQRRVSDIGRRGSYITTIGGRRYYAPLPQTGDKELDDDLALPDRAWREKYAPPTATKQTYDIGERKQLYRNNGVTVNSFEYRLLNYRIQGSAADQTKEAMRRWWRGHLCHGPARFLLTVHDQLVGCCPWEHAVRESAKLDECMVNAFLLSVPVKTDPTYGNNFGEMTTGLPRRTK